MRTALCTAITLFTIIGLSASRAAAQATQPASQLKTAIDDFNTKAAKDLVGKTQPPLTEDEVLAAIALSNKDAFPEASDALFQTFQQIAKTRTLPPGAEIESLNGIDPGGDFVYEVWHIRIRLQKGDAGSYAFTLRARAIRPIPVQELADELEKKLRDVVPMPGTYRLEDRLKALQARAKAAKVHADVR